MGEGSDGGGVSGLKDGGLGEDGAIAVDFGLKKLEGWGYSLRL